MMEPLYGSLPIWSAMPSPPLTWSPAGGPQGGRVSGVGATIPSPSQIRMSPEALGYGAVPSFGLGNGAGVSGAFASIGAAEFLAPTQALVAAIAARRGQPAGPTTDAEVEEFLNEVLDLMPGTSDVEVRCENGRAILTGNVPHKRYKRDVGEIAWAIPSITDVNNNVSIVARRRARATASGREADATTGPVRKHA